jgi:hypothetical protein
MATPPDFTAGQVLTAAQMNAIGLWRITTCTATFTGGTAGTVSNGVINIGSGNTSIAVANAFSADFPHYRIILGGGTGPAATIGLSLGASTTGYYAAYVSSSFAAGTLTGQPGNNGSNWALAGASRTTGAFMNVELLSPFENVRTGFNIVGRSDVDTAGGMTYGAGYHNVVDIYTGFTVSVGGTGFVGGTIRVYGFRA